MAFYDEMQALATEVLGEFKQGAISYIRVVPGNGPADDPGAPVETAFALSAAMRGVKFKYTQSGLALASDMQVTMAVRPDVTPDMRGFIEADGIRYKIVQILPKPAAGTPAVYTLIVRKGG